MELPKKHSLFSSNRKQNFSITVHVPYPIKSKWKYGNQNLSLSTVYLRYHKARTIKATHYF